MARNVFGLRVTTREDKRSGGMESRSKVKRE